jgi:N-methylhydantoinase B
VTTLRTGDRVVVETPGGGGYGDPGKRDRNLIEEDVANGKVSVDAARTLYGWQGD